MPIRTVIRRIENEYVFLFLSRIECFAFELVVLPLLESIAYDNNMTTKSMIVK